MTTMQRTILTMIVLSAAFWSPTTARAAVLFGDMDGNCLLEPEDVPLFILALTDRVAYDLVFPFVDADVIGDIDGSGTFDLGDIGPFSDLDSTVAAAGFSEVLDGPASAQTAPEPSTAVLATLGLLASAKKGVGFQNVNPKPLGNPWQSCFHSQS